MDVDPVLNKVKADFCHSPEVKGEHPWVMAFCSGSVFHPTNEVTLCWPSY